jgi:hypothetical protein
MNETLLLGEQHLEWYTDESRKRVLDKYIEVISREKPKYVIFEGSSRLYGHKNSFLDIIDFVKAYKPILDYCRQNGIAVRLADDPSSIKILSKLHHLKARMLKKLGPNKSSAEITRLITTIENLYQDMRELSLIDYVKELERAIIITGNWHINGIKKKSNKARIVGMLSPELY